MKRFLKFLPMERTFEGESVDYAFLVLVLFSVFALFSGAYIALN